MSESARHTPESASLLEQTSKAITELLLLALAGLSGLAVLFVLTAVKLLPDMTSAPWAAVIAGPILIGSAGLAYLGFERLLTRTDGPARPIDPPGGQPRAGLATGLMIAVGASLLATGGSMILGLIQEFVFSLEVEEQQTITELVERGDPFELTLLVVTAVIFAPLTEELLFRHMFFRRLRQRSGVIAAWTLPGLVFALVHGNPVGLGIYIWLATVFAWAYARTGRLWVAVLVHAAHNGFTVLVLLYAPEAMP